MFNNLFQKSKPVFFICLSLALTACGGGGGGGGGGTTAQPQVAPPLPPPTGYNLTQGTPSTYAGAINGFRTFYEQELSNTLPPTVLTQLKAIPANNFLQDINQESMIAARDTNAPAAWRQGWTGKGVKVGTLDDFSTRDIFFDSFDIPRFASHGELVRLIEFQVAPEITHSAQQLTFGCNVSDATQIQQVRSAYQFMNTNGYHIVNNSFGNDRYDNGICPGVTASLAPTSAWRDLIELSAQDPVTRSIAFSTGAGSYNANMLFVIAAGNEAQGCTFGTAECNLEAATIQKLRTDGETDAGDRVIFVGALGDGVNTLANYSHAAGAMQNDYIVAHDDVLEAGDLSGTSFSAPRVTGAAALVRHKFPNLNGPQLKQVLLQTADDLGARGVDTVFGHGRLNILNALSPVGRVTAR